jgi:putative ABC transport system permease protein
MTLLGVFAGAAVLLALIGIYGVVSYGVTRRTQEFGVRLAMGAREGSILLLVLRQVVSTALVGVALGAAGALVLGGYLQSQLFGISVRDPLTFALVPVLVIAFVLLACLLPARRASRIDPMVALREE